MLEHILLIQLLREYGESRLLNIDAAGYPWGILVRQARAANLLCRIAVFLQEQNILHAIPERPRLHLSNSLKLSAANDRSARWEVKQIYKVLRPVNIDFVLLKGAAYLFSGNMASKGRLFSDTDILVTSEQLQAGESALVHNGWFGDFFDTYNQRYYRQWMHEIPPLRHLQRQTILDVHHTIIPPTSRLHPKPKSLWDQAIELKDMPGVFVLSPYDMILHSATHLFHEGEFKQGLRDISDLDLLMREYVVGDNAWDLLLKRALELDLQRPLFYALNFTQKILHTPVPAAITIESARAAQLNEFQIKLMDALFIRALAPDHETCRVSGAGFAKWLLYIRSHWLKMPWYLLIPHLTRKAWMRLTGKEQH